MQDTHKSTSVTSFRKQTEIVPGYAFTGAHRLRAALSPLEAAVHALEVQVHALKRGLLLKHGLPSPAPCALDVPRPRQRGVVLRPSGAQAG